MSRIEALVGHVMLACLHSDTFARDMRHEQQLRVQACTAQDWDLD